MNDEDRRLRAIRVAEAAVTIIERTHPATPTQRAEMARTAAQRLEEWAKEEEATHPDPADADENAEFPRIH